MLKKLSVIAAGLVALLTVGFAATAGADSPGLFGGTTTDQYQVKNVTQSGSYGGTATAAACDELQYHFRFNNVAYGTISNITVKASLTSGAVTTNNSSITATGTNGVGDTTSTGSSVAVNLSSAQTVAYEAGSTQLLDANGQLVKALPDGIVSGGVNIGDLAGSATESVVFKAKVNCPTPPPTQIKVCDLTTLQIITIDEDQFNAETQSKDLTKCQPPKQITVCKLDTKTIVTINENQFDSSKYSKDLNDCKTTPPPNKLQVCNLTTKQVVTIDETAFDSSKYSKNLNDCAATTTPPAELPNTGAGNVVAVFVGAIVAGTVASRLYLSRKLARK